ncbi:hypothetical protein Tco_1468510 [Tanacetum coccineum]
MRCSTEESRRYCYSLDVQRMSRDATVVPEMFNKRVDMLSLYMRCSTWVGWEGESNGVGGLNGAGQPDGTDGSNGVCESNGEGGSTSIRLDVVEPVWVNDKSREHILPEWKPLVRCKVNLNTLSTGSLRIRDSGCSFKFKVDVLQKSLKELKEARTRDKKLFEEAKGENRKQYEEKLKIKLDGRKAKYVRVVSKLFSSLKDSNKARLDGHVRAPTPLA